MEETPINGIDDEPGILTASEEESPGVFLNYQFDEASFYEPAVDMKEWL